MDNNENSSSAFDKSLHEIPAHKFAIAPILEAAFVGCFIFDFDITPPYMTITHLVVLIFLSTFDEMFVGYFDPIMFFKSKNK